MLFLRWMGEGMPRTESVRQARHNTTWRAALGLEMGDPTPSEKTLRDFELFLQQQHPHIGVPRYLVLHEHLVRTCLEYGVVGEKANWAMDSTPMLCFGAVHGTMRLLGDGLRSLGKLWARTTQTSLKSVARQWGLDLLLSKSTKGGIHLDLKDPEQRAEAFDQLARHVIDVVDAIRRDLPKLRPRKHKKILHRCRNLLKVIRDDLEWDNDGRLMVARRVTQDRLVSILDPQARHGRKSRSKTFKGFKVHVLGDVISGLIASVAVTKGNEHDGAPAPRLIRRAKALCQEIDVVLADTAYGGARLRYVCQQQLGVKIIAPPVPVTLKEGKLGRQDMQINLDGMSAICAAGVETHDWSWRNSVDYGVHVPCFEWPKEACNECSLQTACMGKRRGGHRVRLHPYERQLQMAREDWKDSSVRALYRERSQCERLVNQLTRHGARRARAPGIGAANQQAHIIAMRCNLDLLARQLAKLNSLSKAA
jgi:hypothetical protein